MTRSLLTLPFLFVVLACSKEAPIAAPSGGGQEQGAVDPAASGSGASGSGAEPVDAAADKSFLAGYDDSDCNLSTVLDPNKPGAPDHLIPSPRNPNGDSELAALMRKFVEDLRENKLLAEVGEKITPMHDTHRMMRCAWLTVPSERDEGFDQRAVTYLAAIRNFEATPNQETYNSIINTCVACHTVSCGGVIGFIESLRWQ